ncbi:unnamed protein product [Ectocarpus sp. 13 AM-2016]
MASLGATAEKPGGGEGGEQHINQQQQQQRRRRRLCVCTRVHQNNADRPVDLVKVREFLDTALLYADSVAIAVGTPPPSTDHNGTTTATAAADSTPPLLQSITLAAREAEREAPPDLGVESVGEEGGAEGGAAGVVKVFEVTPWGKFTPALNALLGFASRDGADLVMFQVLLNTNTLPYHCCEFFPATCLCLDRRPVSGDHRGEGRRIGHGGPHGARRSGRRRGPHGTRLPGRGNRGADGGHDAVEHAGALGCGQACQARVLGRRRRAASRRSGGGRGGHGHRSAAGVAGGRARPRQACATTAGAVADGMGGRGQKAVARVKDVQQAREGRQADVGAGHQKGYCGTSGVTSEDWKES